MDNLVIKSLHDTKADMHAIGTVENVLDGIIHKQLHDKTFSAKGYCAGFEAATLNEFSKCGESILINEMCYIAEPVNDPAHTLKLKFSDHFKTSAYFLIPKILKPNYSIDYSATKQSNHNLHQLYDSIYSKINHPITIAALVHFSQLSCTAIAKAPINNEKIFENKEIYYPNPSIKFENCVMAIVGVIGDYKNIKTTKLKSDLNKILYINPFDSITGIQSHTHGLLLKKPVASFADVTSEQADSVWHILIEGSIVSKITGHLYTIASITEC